MSESDTGDDSADNITADRQPLVGVTTTGLANGTSIRMTATSASGQSVSCVYLVGSAESCRLATLSTGDWVLSATIVESSGLEGLVAERLVLTVEEAPMLSVDPLGYTDNGGLLVQVDGADSGSTVTVLATDPNGRRVTCTFVASEETRSCRLAGIGAGNWQIVATTTSASGSSISQSEPIGWEMSPSARGEGPSEPSPLGSRDAVMLLASLLALLALQKRQISGLRRLDSDEREESGAQSFSAGSGSGGLDVREDIYMPPHIDAFDVSLRDVAHRSSRFSPVVRCV